MSKVRGIPVSSECEHDWRQVENTFVIFYCTGCLTITDADGNELVVDEFGKVTIKK